MMSSHISSWTIWVLLRATSSMRYDFEANPACSCIFFIPWTSAHQGNAAELCTWSSRLFATHHTLTSHFLQSRCCQTEWVSSEPLRQDVTAQFLWSLLRLHSPVQDGLNVSAWLQHLAAFVGAACVKYPDIDLHAILEVGMPSCCCCCKHI